MGQRTKLTVFAASLRLCTFHVDQKLINSFLVIFSKLADGFILCKNRKENDLNTSNHSPKLVTRLVIYI